MHFPSSCRPHKKTLPTWFLWELMIAECFPSIRSRTGHVVKALEETSKNTTTKRQKITGHNHVNATKREAVYSGSQYKFILLFIRPVEASWVLVLLTTTLTNCFTRASGWLKLGLACVDGFVFVRHSFLFRSNCTSLFAPLSALACWNWGARVRFLFLSDILPSSQRSRHLPICTVVWPSRSLSHSLSCSL